VKERPFGATLREQEKCFHFNKKPAQEIVQDSSWSLSRTCLPAFGGMRDGNEVRNFISLFNHWENKAIFQLWT